MMKAFFLFAFFFTVTTKADPNCAGMVNSVGQFHSTDSTCPADSAMQDVHRLEISTTMSRSSFLKPLAISTVDFTFWDTSGNHSVTHINVVAEDPKNFVSFVCREDGKTVIAKEWLTETEVFVLPDSVTLLSKDLAQPCETHFVRNAPK